MTKRQITIATRESPLALRQAELIKIELIQYYPDLTIEFLGITTEGDKRLEVSLYEIGGKGLFVKELEEALLDGRADIAVHSMKDVPMNLPEGLVIPMMSQREEVRDVFVSKHYQTLSELPSGKVIGTSSPRRQTQLRAHRADIILKNLRGNIQTRLKKLDQGECDAIILAAAGLIRMDLANRISSYLSIEESLPAAGQGALGVQCRLEDDRMINLLKPLDHRETHDCVLAERALCRRLNGGCKLPLAAYAYIHAGILTLRGLVANVEGTQILSVLVEGSPKDADQIGSHAADQLLQQGAEKILRKFDDYPHT